MPERYLDVSLETYQVGAHLKALDEVVLEGPLDSSYSKVEYNLCSSVVINISVSLISRTSFCEPTKLINSF